MNRCKGCQFFGDEVFYTDYEGPTQEEKPTGYYVCDLVKHGNKNRDLEDHNEKALVVDGSGAFAALRVKEDFGCVEFKEKALVHVVDQPGLPKMTGVHHPLNMETKTEEINISEEEKTVNDDLQAYARQTLKEGLFKCSEASQLLFKRMYSHENLDADINDVVDSVPADKLDWAMKQVQRTLG